MMLSIKQDIRDIKRFKEILVVFLKEGLGYYIHKSKLGSHLPVKDKSSNFKYLNDKEKIAIRLRKSFEKLGPTFVKLGQLLSLRPDLVSPELAKEFEKLQDHVAEFSFVEVKETIEQDLKKSLAELFPYFEKKPLASASIAQVHRAKLANGKEVAVKVQRPGIKELIDTDLDILFLIAYTLEKRFPEIRNYNPVKVVKEFALWTRRELDFQREAENAIRLKQTLGKTTQIIIPTVYGRYCSRRVLTLDFINGEKLSSLIKNKKHNKIIVKTYFFSILEQALLHGLFHADPHPANIFVDKKGHLIFLDFGIVGELTLEDRKKVITFIQSLSKNDPDESLQIILSLAKSVDHQRVDDFKEAALPILRLAYSNSIGEMSTGKALYKIISIGAQNGVVFDPNHVLMAKAVYQAEGLASQLYPQFKVGDGLKEFEQKVLVQEYNPKALINKLQHTLKTQKDLLLELPEHVVKIIEKLEQKSPEHCEQEHFLVVEKHLIKSISRNRATTIATILFIAALIFFYLEGRTTLLGIPISLFLSIIVILLMIYLIISKYNIHWRDEI